jgi:abortive infection bacteriophage resistance protein
MHTWGVFFLIGDFQVAAIKVYDKIPLTYEQHVSLWEDRRLIIPDRDRAMKYFARIGYYRLSAYTPPFQETKDVFNAGTNFDDILNIYLFDRKLRLLVLDAIERIEVTIRAQLVYILAHRYNNSHWLDDSSLFKPPYVNHYGATVDIFNEIQVIISKQLRARKPEVFIKHYIDNYKSPANPPSWMCMELLTIGELSHLFKGLASNADKREIASFFSLQQKVFESWLHTLTYVRNICAHHARLWNRDFAIRPDLYEKPIKPWMKTDFTGNNHRSFYFLCMLKYLLNEVNPNNHFKTKLISLIEKYPSVPIRYLGIPTKKDKNLIDWQNEPLWSK